MCHLSVIGLRLLKHTYRLKRVTSLIVFHQSIVTIESIGFSLKFLLGNFVRFRECHALISSDRALACVRFLPATLNSDFNTIVIVPMGQHATVTLRFILGNLIVLKVHFTV